MLWRVASGVFILLAGVAAWAADAETTAGDNATRLLITRPEKPRFGDLPELRKSRFIRVLTSYSKTNFFLHNGQPRGFEYELLHAYEQHLNQGVANALKKVQLVYIPVPFDTLFHKLEQGHGDIAAAGLTITPERSQSADFTTPYITNVAETVVEHKGAERLQSLDSLAGKKVSVRAGSSYVDHLGQLSKDLVSRGLDPISIVKIDNRMTTEDILEMVNAGVLDYTVADKHIADAWAGVLPHIVVRPDLTIHAGGDIAWAVRKNCPELLKSLNTFLAKNKKGSLLGNILFKRYFTDSRWITDPATHSGRSRLRRMEVIFKTYGKQYDIDWLALAAQGYQESGLDNSKRSSAGAVGVMQLLPSTAKNPPVSIPDYTALDGNIHAGAKYMHHLREQYFNDAKLPGDVRMDFAWAAYNAGPNRIAHLRAKAAKRGYDPDRWFANVEAVAAEEVGRQVVDYVANINKYYIAYRLSYEERGQKSHQTE